MAEILPKKKSPTVSRSRHDMKIDIPEYAEKIIGRLEAHGHEGYIVGGCVRDSLIGRTPGDFDITTSATPDKLTEIFSADGFSAVPTGIAHGTVTVICDKTAVEVTTYRIDGEYSDFRRPDKVEFTPSLAEDLKRRDFTVNAMAYSEKSGIIDLHGGIADLEEGVIRAVGDPKKRFTEDALRILRAVRFCSVLDFKMDADTEAAARELSHLLAKISPERISAELSKMLMGRAAARVIDDYSGILAPILGLTCKPSTATFEVLGELSVQLPVRLAALYLDCDDVKSKLRGLRFDGKTAAKTVAIIENYGEKITDYISVKHLCRKIGIDTAKSVATLQFARGELPREALGYFDEIEARGECVSLGKLALNGNDLMALGYTGSEIGEALEYLLTEVIENRIKNEVSELLDAAKHIRMNEK